DVVANPFISNIILTHRNKALGDI
ncbi:hypothetical protein LCGC14_1272430, partial [marine sediment metagenome]